ncbi:DUF4168 domain-containing protein [Wenzhouxiangella sediminis]|uniref:DUF4168 domain-containing protein n=1 Tax=Wenzhouxiangella sediminis TaxID=1792836 RepID=A0A3E1KBZ1_9GAMM|nr:DUF4168 domain-containing protein [Wenzhouxiangella sediminis]RFF32243.1 DUF4168 domain-containing protein [Wenzhouxiangella sediminis]
MQFRTTLKLFAVAGTLMIGSVAVAQEAAQQSRQSAPQTIEVSDQQLQQFADAQMEIASIQKDFRSRLQNVEDPQKAQELQREANEEMTTAVEEVGLDVESFNQIAMSIQNDPELQQELTQMLQEQQQ